MLFYHIDEQTYVHDLKLSEIQAVLYTASWQIVTQLQTSASTNTYDSEEPNEEYLQIGENTSGPDAFADLPLTSDVKRMLDVGGGKFDGNRNYMSKRHVDLLIWDPYNRTPAHNLSVQTKVQNSKVDAVSSMSVLNVIPELAARLAHIITVKDALKIHGQAYFKIWPGEDKFKGSYSAYSNVDYYQANSYPDRFLREVEIVFGENNARIHPTIPNLIVAIKTNANATITTEVRNIRAKSRSDFKQLILKERQSIEHIGRQYNVTRLLLLNSRLFKSATKVCVEEHLPNDQVKGYTRA